MQRISAENRLAVYGTLAPGRVNHHQLAGLIGDWREGVVRGKLESAGWGADLGFPDIRLYPAGEEVRVLVFTSLDLPQHWDRLDEFEGNGYRRAIADVYCDGEVIHACIYVLPG